jgi:uncharacterized protein YndB with AHSA1/START domain
MTARPPALRLEVRRLVRASPARVWAAWTDPTQLAAWWGPPGVRCTGATLDLRPGGRYRIDHRFPDGRTLAITGELVAVTAPVELVYTWTLEPGPADQVAELVTVRFEARADATEVVVVHERITDPARRADHAAGWDGCLDGLAAHVAPAGPAGPAG